jgi:acetyl esterase
MAAMSRAEGAEPIIDADILAAQKAVAGRAFPLDPATQTPPEMRRLSEISGAVWTDGLPAIAQVETIEINGPAGPLRARWFDPRDGEALTGAMLFLHGGGWTTGSVDTHDRLMRSLAAKSVRPVLGLDYRLSPEHPFPAALEDSCGGFEWLIDQADALGINSKRIAIVGDSAGANIGLATALRLRTESTHVPSVLTLFYPCLAPDFGSNSYAAYGSGRYGLSTERMIYYWRNYLGTLSGDPPFLAAPLRAPLESLPPTYVGFAELDPLADDSRRLAERLREAQVTYQLDCWRGAVHGFMQMTRDVPLAREAVSAAVTFLHAYL